MQQVQSLPSCFGDSIEGEQPVSTVEKAVKWAAFLDEIRQKPVSECFHRVVVFCDAVAQPCGLVAGITGQVTLPYGRVAFFQPDRSVLTVDSAHQLTQPSAQVAREVTVAAQRCRQEIL